MNEQNVASKKPDEIAPLVSGLAEGSEAVRLPLYQCFKLVRAAKIADIQISEEMPSAILFFGDIPGQREVTEDWFNKHSPEVGGYFVRYADGYESYSPAKAFEEGYSKIETSIGTQQQGAAINNPPPGKNPKSSPTEEIQYLGRMLTATTIEDKERLEAIIKDLTRLSASAQV